MSRQFFVYILASAKHGTLYIGVTSDLIRRAYEHREKLVPGFTKRYGVCKLVYFEVFDTPMEAIAREAVEGMAERMEDSTCRGPQTGIERPRVDPYMKVHRVWIPARGRFAALAGMTLSI
jgi:predicted GIY-YIG superfamily endonuclease